MKGKNWWGIFYRIEDCIMYFTTFSVFARRSEMVFIAFSIMFNHTHATTLNETKQRITLFQRQVGVSTAHTYNREYGREGQLWHHSYGSSLKIAIKRILSNVAYAPVSASVSTLVESLGLSLPYVVAWLSQVFVRV